jgi:midasin
MVGLEVILKHAQDWEQHASVRVKIGLPLTDVSQLVTQWRKLELQSWPGLLRAREIICETRAGRHWARVHLLVQAQEFELREADQGSVVPQWVWKSMNSEGRRLSPMSTGSDECFLEILKALDTFILTAPLGEYKTRLDMVRSFANQLQFESISLARSLSSLWRFYSQFSQSLEGEIRKFRLPLEKKLVQELKLAKWDEQTYYMSRSHFSHGY